MYQEFSWNPTQDRIGLGGTYVSRQLSVGRDSAVQTGKEWKTHIDSRWLVSLMSEVAAAASDQPGVV